MKENQRERKLRQTFFLSTFGIGIFTGHKVFNSFSLQANNNKFLLNGIVNNVNELLKLEFDDNALPLLEKIDSNASKLLKIGYTHNKKIFESISENSNYLLTEFNRKLQNSSSQFDLDAHKQLFTLEQISDSREILERIYKNAFLLLEGVSEYDTKKYLFFLCIGIIGGYIAGRAIWKGFSLIHNYLKDDNIKNIEKENEYLRDKISDLTRIRDELNRKRENIEMYRESALVKNNDSDYEPDDATPDRFICPITRMIMRDPVYLITDKRCYERQALQLWYDYGNDYCPINRDIKLSNPKTIPTDSKLKLEVDEHIRVKNQGHSPWYKKFF